MKFPNMLPVLLLCAAWSVVAPAHAQFSTVPAPKCQKPKPSAQQEAGAYRIEAAKHLYACFPAQVYSGKLPPLLYGVMVVELEIGPAGRVKNISVVRKPAADEVAPWVMALIQRAGPFPAPARMAGKGVKVIETFFVDKAGLFQTLSLSEGQQ